MATGGVAGLERSLFENPWPDQGNNKAGLYFFCGRHCSIPREVDCHPLANVETKPRNQVLLGFPPGVIFPSGDKDLVCRSDNRRRLHPHADIKFQIPAHYAT
jgi:hypothetical protein